MSISTEARKILMPVSKNQIPTSPIYQNFSSNLMTQCTRHGSIASVCRALGMNRQQFNKYLSGTQLPSPATLEKICRLFKIDATALFEKPAEWHPHDLQSATEGLDVLERLSTAHKRRITQLLETSRTVKLKEGAYFMYYPWRRDPQLCARAAIIIRHRNDLTHFSRFLKIRLAGDNQKLYYQAKHDGLVFETENSHYFVGRNASGFGDVSLLSFGPSNQLRKDLMSGIALVKDTRADPVALRVVLEFQGGGSIVRRTIKAAGLLSSSDPTVPEEVRRCFAITPGLNVPQLRPYSMIDDIYTQSPAV